MTEHYRRLFPASSGSIFWQYNEPCTDLRLEHCGLLRGSQAALHALKQVQRTRAAPLKDKQLVHSGRRPASRVECTVAPHATSDRTRKPGSPCGLPPGSCCCKRKRLALTAGTQTLLRLKEKVPGGDVLARPDGNSGNCFRNPTLRLP